MPERFNDIEPRRLGWVLACLAIAILPHLDNVPLWVLMVTACSALWRLAASLRDWPLAPRWLRSLAAFIAVSLIAIEFRTLNGLDAGTALLVLMAGVKLIETRTARDLTVLLFIAYFLLFAAFLYRQSLPWLPYMLAATWLLTATLLRIHGSWSLLPKRASLGLTARMLVTALPVATLLFLFFPRLPGQFWALPASGDATTGLSDEMSPGDISDLSLDDTPAFRVRFDDEVPPPPAQRYWRGPVLHDFDGRAWRAGRSFLRPPTVEKRGQTYRYTITLEPHNRRWLIALDMPTQWPQNRAQQAGDFLLYANDPISTVRSFRLESTTRYVAGLELSTYLRRIDLALPERGNERARALAQSLRLEQGSDEAVIAAVLRLFREQEFFYTLEPPGLASNAVDDFLFNTRRGFCEHFASAFTFLMRAAAVPARVVTGYQGGTINPFSGDMTVRQSDAHAWSEVWLEGRGWVRVDPTAAVAPDRIEQGLDAALPEGEPVPGRFIGRSRVLASLSFAWDAMNSFWNNQIVEFDAGNQAELLELVGLDDGDWRALGIAMALTLALFFAGMTVYLAWSYRPRPQDPARAVYDRVCDRFARLGLERRPDEGPRDYLERLAAARPELATDLDEVRRLYLALRYGPEATAKQMSRLRFVANRLRV
jgi:transglutaminase-like putative cysteine protease